MSRFHEEYRCKACGETQLLTVEDDGGILDYVHGSEPEICECGCDEFDLVNDRVHPSELVDWDARAESRAERERDDD